MRPRLTVFVVLGMIATAGRAHAEAPTAETLFEEGRRLVLAKRYDAACPKLAESLRLDHGIGTLLWLGDCLEKRGDLDAAWMRFHDAEQTAARQHDERAVVAARHATALENRVARYVIVMAADPSIELRRDGILLASEEVGTEQAIAAGFHTFAATASGRHGWSATVEITPRPSAIIVNVPVLRSAPEEAPTAIARVESVTAPPAAAPTLTTKRYAALGLGAAGVLGIGLGAYFGLHARSTYDRSNQNDHCDAESACDAAGKAFRADARSQALVSTVSIAGGAAALGAGALLWVLGKRATVGVTPTVGPRTAGLAFERRW